MNTDTISDMLTRIRNGLLARKDQVILPYSNFKHSLAKVLQSEGYIQNVEVIEKTEENGSMRTLSIRLKYDQTGTPVISEIKRVSKPGQRIYSGRMEIPSVMGGVGTTIISTSKGLMTDKQARKNKIGGEIVCQIW